jgi:hypothetical protein
MRVVTFGSARAFDYAAGIQYNHAIQHLAYVNRNQAGQSGWIEGITALWNSDPVAYVGYMGFFGAKLGKWIFLNGPKSAKLKLFGLHNMDVYVDNIRWYYSTGRIAQLARLGQKRVLAEKKYAKDHKTALGMIKNNLANILNWGISLVLNKMTTKTGAVVQVVVGAYLTYVGPTVAWSLVTALPLVGMVPFVGTAAAVVVGGLGVIITAANKITLVAVEAGLISASKDPNGLAAQIVSGMAKSAEVAISAFKWVVGSVLTPACRLLVSGVTAIVAGGAWTLSTLGWIASGLWNAVTALDMGDSDSDILLNVDYDADDTMQEPRDLHDVDVSETDSISEVDI